MAEKGISKVVSSTEDLNAALGFDKSITGIKPKFTMPVIGGKAKTFVILESMENGQRGALHTVKHADFNGGEGLFMVVEEYGNQGTQYQMGIGASLKRGLVALCNDNGWTPADLPGKIVNIVASPYPKYTCKTCGGKGCALCGNTGSSTVFSLTARLDLMRNNKPTNVAKSQDEF